MLLAELARHASPNSSSSGPEQERQPGGAGTALLRRELVQGDQGPLRPLLDTGDPRRASAVRARTSGPGSTPTPAQAEYGGAWDAIAARSKSSGPSRSSRYYGSRRIAAARDCCHAGSSCALPEEPPKPNAAATPRAYRADGLDKARQAVQRGASIDKELENANAGRVRSPRARKELGHGCPSSRRVLGQGVPAKWRPRRWSKGSTLADPATRKALLDGGKPRRCDASEDPMIVLARKVDADARARCARYGTRSRRWSGQRERIGQGALRGLWHLASTPMRLSPCASSYGRCRAFTRTASKSRPSRRSLYGLYSRSADFDDQPPFQLPERWKARRRSTGSHDADGLRHHQRHHRRQLRLPRHQQNAEVVGLIFDGNIQSLPNRFIFTDEVARSVAVHSRGITEALRKVYDAGRVADELEGSARVSQQ